MGDPIKGIDLTSFSSLKPSSKSGPFSIKLPLPSGLKLQLGEIVLVELKGVEGDNLLISIGNSVFRAKGQANNLEVGDKFFLKVLDLGPPLKMEFLGTYAEAPPEKSVVETEYLALRITLLGLEVDEKAILKGLGSFFSGNFVPRYIFGIGSGPGDVVLAFLIKEALSALMAEGEEAAVPDDASPESRFFRAIKGVLSLEAAIKGQAGIDAILAPIFFESRVGRGLLAIYKRREQGHYGENRKGHRGRAGVEKTWIEMDLYMTMLGHMQIIAALSAKNLEVSLRVREAYKKTVENGLYELKERLAKLGYAATIKVDSFYDAPISSEDTSGGGLFDQIATQKIHLIV